MTTLQINILQLFAFNKPLFSLLELASECRCSLFVMTSSNICYLKLFNIYILSCPKIFLVRWCMGHDIIIFKQENVVFKSGIESILTGLPFPIKNLINCFNKTNIFILNIVMPSVFLYFLYSVLSRVSVKLKYFT